MVGHILLCIPPLALAALRIEIAAVFRPVWQRSWWNVRIHLLASARSASLRQRSSSCLHNRRSYTK